MHFFRYRAMLVQGANPGEVIISFPDVPEAITESLRESEALDEAQKALGNTLLSYLREGRALPAPRAVRWTDVSVPPAVAAKLAVLQAFSEAGISKSELARRIGRSENEARRILDPAHPTKLRRLEQALAALGRRLVVGVEDLASEP